MPGFQIQVETLTPAEQAELKSALDEAFTIATENGSEVYAPARPSVPPSAARS